jgi:hypothetical protein
MNETTKTLTFVAIAVLAVGGAYLFDSTAASVNVQQLVGQSLNADIDLTAPRRLEIVKFDRQTASVRRFEVAEVDGVWSIPSKENYPADATQQMAEAATCVMNREILRIAGETADQHEQFGVVDPLAPGLDSQSAGVGTRVVMTDADDDELVDMIIGKAVPNAEGQRFVRRSDQDVTYVVELDPKQLSTDFADWIEDDLLKLNVMDLRKVFINDYSADLRVGIVGGQIQRQVSLDPRNGFTLVHDAESDPWKLAEFTAYDPNSSGGGDPRDALVPAQLAEDEEVNQESVDGLVSGLDDLLIVDVAHKPAGLSADLKAGQEFLNSNESIIDLVEKGFIPLTSETGADILSSEGEVVCTLRNGVEYVLRFGQLQVQTESAEGAAAESQDVDAADADAEIAADADAAADAETAADADAAEPADAATKGEETGDDGGENLRRYLFVMARFNEDAIAKPEYKALPELPPEEAGEGDAAAAENGETEEAPADTAETDAAEPAETNDDTAESESADESSDAEASTSEVADKPDDAKAKREAIIAERESIQTENDRLKEEYESLVAAGKKEVADLNERFGDWYFVISNNVYKEIHLGRDKLIKKKAPPEGEAGDDAATAAPGGLEGVPALPGALDGALDAAGDETAPMEDAAAEEAPADEAPADAEPSEEAAAPDATGDEAPAEEPAAEEPAAESAESTPPADQPEVPPAPTDEEGGQ